MERNDQALLKKFRKEINQIDERILNLLAKRKTTVVKIGKLKKKNNWPVLDKKRWQKVIKCNLTQAEKLKLDKDLVKKIYEIIHEYSLKIEEEKKQ